MSRNINCFTITEKAKRRSGIPFEDGIRIMNRHGQFVVPVGEAAIMLYLGANGRRDPGISQDSSRVLQAEAYAIKHQIYRLVKPGIPKSRIIVRIIGQGLIFDFPPLAEGLGLWPGGDGDLRPFVQVGRHKEPAKDQLFEVREGEYFLAVDTRGAVAKVSCASGEPSIEPLAFGETVEFFVKRATAQRKTSAIEWALHNLRILRADGNNPDNVMVKSAINKVSRLRQKRTV